MIFLICPPQIATGGPESLHLLARELVRLGHDARMTYIPAGGGGTHAEYAEYGVRTADVAIDAAEHTIIAPEIWTWRLDSLSAIRKVIWWLSVDNYVAAGNQFDFGARENSDVQHLVGSAYARAFISARGARRVAALSSYVHEIFASADGGEREDMVVYNPKKGADVVEHLRKETPGVIWRPLEGLPREGVAAALARAKVYVDFGHHPGKERLPREAVAAGCCVITGMRGSAAFFADVPIPAAYKFDDRRPLSPLALDAIADAIVACVRDYASRRVEFEPYRAIVLAEKAIFEAAVRALFRRQTRLLD